MKKLFTLAIICCSFLLKAQEYSFVKDIQAYDYLSGATLVNTNFSTLDSIDIPFTFKYYDQVVSKIYVQNSSFGFMGTDMHGSPFQVNLSNNDSGGIYYLLEGNTGEQILKIDWRNALLSDADIAGSDSVNFQVWLYELSNEIEFHYGICNIDSATYENITGQCFLKNFAGNKSIHLYGSPNLPMVSNNNSTMTDGLDTFPPSGFIYRFSPTNNSHITKNNTEISYIIYPNPFNEIIHVSSEKPISKLKVYNMEGKCLVDENSNEINTSNLTSGVYLLQIFSDNNIQYQKIMKE